MDNCHLHRHVVLIIESSANVSCVQINSYHLNRKSHHLLLEVVQLAVLLVPVLDDVVAFWLLVHQGLRHLLPKVQSVVDVAAAVDQALSKNNFGAST